MNFELKHIDQIVRRLEITVDPETYQKDFQKAFRKYSQKVQIDGFRKGRAPANVIQRLYGEHIKAFYFDENASNYYKLGLEETKAKPITVGQFVDATINDDGTAVFIFEFESFPENFTYEYQGLRVRYKPVEYKEEMLDKTIENLLSENAEEVPFEADMCIEMGDKVKFMAVETKYEYPDFYLSENTLKTHLNADINNIIGLKINDKFTCEEKEYQIIDAFRKNLPPLNDETAKILGHDSVEAMKTKIRENLISDIEKRNEADMNFAISYAFGEKNQENIPIPKDYMLDVGKRLILRNIGAQYGKDFVDQLPEELIMNAADQQLPNVVWDVAFDQIAKDNDITVSDAEFDADIERYAGDFNISVEEFKTKYAQSLEGLRDDLLSRKVIAFIKPFCVFDDGSGGYEIIDEEPAQPKEKKKTKKTTTTDDIIDVTPVLPKKTKTPKDTTESKPKKSTKPKTKESKE